MLCRVTHSADKAFEFAIPVADDFNGTPRAGIADIGAYLFSADGNPCWELAETPKASTPTNDPGTGGTGGGVGGSAGSGGISGNTSSGNSSPDGVAQLMLGLIFALLWRRRARRASWFGPS